MEFNSNGNVFQCVCEHDEFNEAGVVALVEWCSLHASDWNYAVSSQSTFEIRDFGEGLEQVGTSWSVRIWFEHERDAVAFTLVLDSILAEAV